jgi:hypothetical protein
MSAQSLVVENVASMIADALDFAIKQKAKCSNWVRCEVLSVSFPNDFSKIEEELCFCAGEAFVDEAGELLRVYFNLNNSARFSIMRDAVQMALEPFFVGRGNIVAHDFEEGFKIISLDDRKINYFHEQLPVQELQDERR